MIANHHSAGSSPVTTSRLPLLGEDPRNRMWDLTLPVRFRVEGCAIANAGINLSRSAFQGRAGRPRQWNGSTLQGASASARFVNRWRCFGWNVRRRNPVVRHPPKGSGRI